MKHKAILWHEPISDGRHAVYIYISHNGQKKYRQVKDVYIHKGEFKKGKRLPVTDRHPNAEYLNNLIKFELDGIENYYLNNKGCTIDELKNWDKLNAVTEHIQQVTEAAKPAGLLKYIEEYVKGVKAGKITDKRTGRVIKKATAPSFNSLRIHLMEFEQARPEYDGLCYEHITEEFYQEYLHFLRYEIVVRLDKNKQPVRGMAESSIGRDIKKLKKFMRLTRKQHRNFDYEDFYAPNDEPEPFIPNRQEVEAVLTFDTSSHPHLLEEKERAVVAYNFLFRFGDSMRLDPGSFEQVDDRLFLRKETQKTGEFVYIPVTERTLYILQKHKFRLPVIHNQESNWKLRELFRLAGVTRPFTRRETRAGVTEWKTYEAWQLIGTHELRRAKATHLYEDGFTLQEIMFFGGWTDERQLRRYLRLDKKELARRAAQKASFQ